MTSRAFDVRRLTDPPTPRVGVTVGIGEPAAADAEFWLQNATFTLTEDPAGEVDRRVVRVDSVRDTLAHLEERVARWPHAAAVCDDVLRSVDVHAPARPGIIAESLGYSTLQSGPEFARWLAERGPARPDEREYPVLADREGDVLRVRFNRPQRHNAFDNGARAALLEALAVAQHDTSVREVVLAGNGPSFCSGGDLAEFGTFADPVSAHLARTRHSPALVLDELTRRLGPACRAHVHGMVLGSGLEMASFCGEVRCAADAVLGLPELTMGLIPGAGGTVGITRRIGRWRTAFLVLSGHTVDPSTALTWGLVDALE